MNENSNFIDTDLDEDIEQDDSIEIEKVELLNFKVDKGQEPIRIDKFILTKIVNTTRNKIQNAIEAGNVLVNGKIVKCNHKALPNDHIIVYAYKTVSTAEIIPEEMPLDIVYEDDDVVVINKAPGMVVHPGCGNYTGTLVNGMAHYLQNKDSIAGAELPRVGLVHRIDKFTSGLLLFAKNEVAMAHLAAQFKAHTVKRTYFAIAWGDFDEDEGTINCNVARDLRFRKMMQVYPEGDHGKHAITHYKVLERFGYVSVIECVLETGRTHQIRVHMKSIGHALFNDTTYGGDRILKGTIYTKYKQFVENCFKILPRQALHARTLGFVHPTTGKDMFFESTIPTEMLDVIEKWRIYTKAKNTRE